MCRELYVIGSSILSNRVLHAILHMYLPYKVFENVLMKNKTKIKK